jgi:hypothetical protein
VVGLSIRERCSSLLSSRRGSGRRSMSQQLLSKYTKVLYQAMVAIQFIKQHKEKACDIRQISILTGFSEEAILEAMEFGEYEQHNRHGKAL